MKTISVPAIRAFEHETRQYESGDLVTVSPAIAASLARRQLVTLDRMARPMTQGAAVQSEMITKDLDPPSQVISTPQSKPKRTRTSNSNVKLRRAKSE